MLPLYVKKTILNALKSLMSVPDTFSTIAAFEINVENIFSTFFANVPKGSDVLTEDVCHMLDQGKNCSFDFMLHVASQQNVAAICK